MNEKQIILSCKNRERSGQKAFVDSYSKYMYTICVRYVHDREIAKDVLQESLLQVLNNIHKYEEIGLFKSWISKVTVYKCLEHLRKEKKFQAVELNEINEPSLDAPVEHSLNEETVLSFINKLPDKYRVAINMYIVEGYSHKEIGAYMGITESSSRSLVTRGRKLIKDQFPAEMMVSHNASKTKIIKLQKSFTKS